MTARAYCVVPSPVRTRRTASEVEDATCVVGDSWLLHNVISEADREHVTDFGAGAKSFSYSLFYKVMNEVNFQEVSHKGGLVPRLMAIQGMVNRGKWPCYRHPLDGNPPVLPFTSFVTAIRRALIIRMLSGRQLG